MLCDPGVDHLVIDVCDGARAIAGRGAAQICFDLVDPPRQRLRDGGRDPVTLDIGDAAIVAHRTNAVARDRGGIAAEGVAIDVLDAGAVLAGVLEATAPELVPRSFTTTM